MVAVLFSHLLKLELDPVIIKGNEQMIVLSDPKIHHCCSTTKETARCVMGIIQKTQLSCKAHLLKGFRARTNHRCQQQLKVLDPNQEDVI